eukprot:jgi/Undpi1/10308/HiC_scaffold_28.g12759.m1
MPRAPSSRRGGCGLTKHGKPNPDGGLALCFACGRAGARNGSSTGWRHVGSGPFWSALEQWSANIGAAWVHARDLTTEPLVDGECLCSRSDCVVLMHRRFSRQQQKAEKGSLETMATGQSSPLGRYPSTSFQVRALLEHVEVNGEVLDICGATQDAVNMALAANGLRTSTNDLNRCLQADTHYDASSEQCVKAFTQEARCIDWMVTSPLYKNAFTILGQALRIARVGVAFKLRLSFLEPSKARGPWFKENPPSVIAYLPRATYRGRVSNSPEAWFVWRRQSVETSVGQRIFFAI